MLILELVVLSNMMVIIGSGDDDFSNWTEFKMHHLHLLLQLL
jgi:hypothetical protein